MKVSTVIFDFGGVIAEEGWAKGIRVIASKIGNEPESFFELCVQAINDTGFCLGKVDEYSYWDYVKTKVKIDMSVEELRAEILPRFVVRPYVTELVEKLSRKYTTAILSDQTHWLDELNRRDGFFKLFHHVFNSYHDGNSKQSVSYFTDTCRKLNVSPQETVFIDDNKGNIERARSIGMNAILYVTFDEVIKELKDYVEI